MLSQPIIRCRLIGYPFNFWAFYQRSKNNLSKIKAAGPADSQRIPSGNEVRRSIGRMLNL